MPDREVASIMDGKLRINATLPPGPRSRGPRTSYSVELAPDKYASVWLHGLDRHHLVALHYSLTQELARTAIAQEARFRR